ncbi:YcxB family protein [Aliidiomarina maris]|uniref:YcxB-like protein n=1 Tax=Aliidiomarina maris TaxID=531312 RepID=A0A327WW28_9GAMM|nr:YcxB family protein [Aliidiomarina maris]RAJ93310.1 YcxB-like protein [Aliidiomarina maris]RUO18564.1 hypothetical protein CWE07_13785 [Aliidiomarina maris]
MFSTKIRYTYAEYKSIVDAVMLQELGHPASAKWHVQLFSHPICFCIFMYKSITEGTCEFVFTADGFERVSNSGSTQMQWSNIGRVVDIKDAFLLIGATDGIAPLPKRCFSQEQISLIKSWAGGKLASEL